MIESKPGPVGPSASMISLLIIDFCLSFSSSDDDEDKSMRSEY